MIKIQEVVERAEWFPEEDFNRPEAVATVEENLRDRHDISGVAEVEVSQQISGEWKVKVTGWLVDEDGEGA